MEHTEVWTPEDIRHYPECSFPQTGRKYCDIDHVIAGNVARIRASKKVTLAELANNIGVIFQAVSRYELGYSRIPSSRLWKIAIALDVPIEDFFEGCED